MSTDLDFISTQLMCDSCGAAAATTECQTKTGTLVFCDHDFRKQMKSPKFQEVLLTAAPIK